MLLQYFFEGNQYGIIANWTDDKGHSVVYRDIVAKLVERHGPVFASYGGIARELDEKVDKLYRRIYIFGDEYHAIPYNPKFRKQFIQAFSDICDILASGLHAGRSEPERILAGLFMQILDKLQEIVGIYLLDNAYQGKYLYRRKNFEEWAETTDEKWMQYEFEDVLLQMTDLSRLLDCLTNIQRRRLVKHLFLKYTLREIAEQENVSEAMVHKSVAAAHKKLKQLLAP